MATLTARSYRLDKLYRSYRKKRRGAAVVPKMTIAVIVLMLMLEVAKIQTPSQQQNVLDQPPSAACRSLARVVIDKKVTGCRRSEETSGANVSVTPNPPSNTAFGDPVTVAVTRSFDQVNRRNSPMDLGSRYKSSPNA